MTGMRLLFRFIPLFTVLGIVSIAIACGGGGGGETACEKAFSNAADISDFNDTVEDLDPAVRACASVSEWAAASNKYPGALDGVSPLTFLQNRCRFGPTTAAICAETLR